MKLANNKNQVHFAGFCSGSAEETRRIQEIKLAIIYINSGDLSAANEFYKDLPL